MEVQSQYRWMVGNPSRELSAGTLFRLLVRLQISNECLKHHTQSCEYWPLMVGRPGGGQKMGHFYGKHYEIIGLKALYLSASDWFTKIPISLL